MRRRLNTVDLAAGLSLLLVPLAVSAATGAWVWAAIPCGILLGFFLARGDLCGASAFSEIVLMRDGRKLFGLFVAAVTSMGAFAVADALGLVTLCPRPLYLASYLVAGAVFGVGMVLAGGCVSGTLYKTGLGHVNSMVALIAIPTGMHLVDFGPLHGVDDSLRKIEIPGAAGLHDLVGLPFGAFAAIFAVAAIAMAIRFRRPPPKGVVRRPSKDPLVVRILTRPWRPAAAGIAVGLLAVPAWLSSVESGRDFPLCVSYGVEEIPLMATSVEYVWRADQIDIMPGGAEKRVYVWLVLFVTAIVLGSLLSARLAGRSRVFLRPPGQLLAAAIGGVLVGIGAALARGCILGNGVMGLAMLSIGMVLFAVVAMLANWATTRLWVMGR